MSIHCCICIPVLALVLLSVDAQSTDGLDWIDVKRVAFTLEPKFGCKYSSFEEGSVVIDWVDTSGKSTGRFQIEANGVISQTGNFVRLNVTRRELNTLKLHVRLIQKTSQGEAVLPVSFNFSPNLNTGEPYLLQLSPALSPDGNSVSMVRLTWTSGISNDPQTVIVLVYNRTHITQHQSSENHLLFHSLVPGGLYKFCVIRASRVCDASAWSCIVWMVPVPLNSNALSTHPIEVRQLSVIHTTDTTVQLSWLPPERSLRLGLSDAPRSYLIVAKSNTSGLPCDVHLYYTQAPWLTDSRLISEALNSMKNNLKEDCPPSALKPTLLNPLGGWPDWEKHLEQEDEWGPFGDFTVELGGLIPRSEYVVQVWPITDKRDERNADVVVRTSSPEDVSDFQLKRSDAEQSFFELTLASSLLKRLRSSHSFHLSVQRIGQPSLGNLTDSCFVRGCADGKQLDVYFEPQPFDAPQRLHCTHKIIEASRSIVHRQELSFSCLLPCVVYEVRVSPTSPDPVCKEYCLRKRFVRPGQAPEPSVNSKLTVLASNLLMLQLNVDSQRSTHDYCATVGYVLTMTDKDTLSTTGPMLFTERDLKLRWHVPLLRVEKEGKSDSHSLILTNPFETSSSLKLTIQNVPIDTRRRRKADLHAHITGTDCTAHCVQTSVLPFTLSSMQSTYHAHPYTSFHVLSRGFGRFNPCQKWTVSSRSLPTPCEILSNLAYSDHAFCRLDRGWGTCSVPVCTDLAALSCVTRLTIHHVDTTYVDAQMKLDTFPSSLSKALGFVATLSIPSTVSKRASTCIQAYVLSSNRSLQWTNKQGARFIDDLLRSCPESRLYEVYNEYDETVDLTFAHLSQNRSYELRITPFDHNGRIGATHFQSVKTKEAAPCKPENFLISYVASRAITFNWTVPTGPDCGAPTEVQLHYYAKGVLTPQPLKVNPGNSLRLPHLTPCQNYCAAVQFVNDVSAGPMSREACAVTKRLAFTQIPTLTHRLSMPDLQASTGHFQRLPNDAWRWNPDEFVTCHLRIQLDDYPATCPVRYEVWFGVYNTDPTDCERFDRNDVVIANRFQLGLLYQVRVRALSTEYWERLNNPCGAAIDSNHASQWSSPIDVFTGTGQIKLTNLSIDVKPPSTVQDMALCVPEGPRHHGTPPIIQSNHDDLCFQLRLGFEGRPRGMIGLLVLFFGDLTVSGPEDDGVETHTLSRCIHMLWIPCEDCLGQYSLANADQSVWTLLDEIISPCVNHLGQNTLLGSTRTTSNDAGVPPLLHEQLEHAVASKMHVSLNRTSVELVLNMTGNIFGHRRIRDAQSADSKLDIQASDHGSVHFYSVTAVDVKMMTQHPWYLKVPGSSIANLKPTAWAGIVAGLLLVVALMLWLLIAFDAKRRRRLRHSNLQRVMDYGLPGGEDDEAVFQMEMKQPIVPPRISKFLLRQPDPISVHDFVAWYEKQKFNKFTAIREEFKWLRIHSLRQEQAKRLIHHTGQRPENKLRNKYRNLVPFDHNYVHLLKPWRLVDINPLVAPGADSPDQTKKQSEETNRNEDIPVISHLEDDLFGAEQWIASDYVNASLISGRAPGVAYGLIGSNLLPRTYIAAQAPIPQTKGLFWQMIWDHGVKLIVLLTRLCEDGKEKCVQYWPDGSDDPSHDTTSSKILKLRHFTITLVDVVNTSVYIKRKFTVHNSLAEQDDPHTVTQIHMLQWPDFSAPTSANFSSLLHAYWTERRCHGDSPAPVLVHCSAGIGRTGTFICLDQLCHQVRYYLQPDFQLMDTTPPMTPSAPDSWEEPVYVNVKYELEDPKRMFNGNEHSLPSSKGDNEVTTDGEVAVRQNLLRNGDSRLRKRLFGLGRRKTNCVDVYRTVLWLRSNRSFMVQSEEQYLFIYQYLAYFIQKINNSEEIYVNI